MDIIDHRAKRVEASTIKLDEGFEYNNTIYVRVNPTGIAPYEITKGRVYAASKGMLTVMYGGQLVTPVKLELHVKETED